ETKGSGNSLEIYTKNNHVRKIELYVKDDSDTIPRTTENNTREDEYTSEKISSIAKNVWGSRVKWDDDVYAYFGFYEGDNPSECGMIFLSQQGDGSFHFSYYDGMATIEESDMDLGINILGRSVYTQKYTFAEESCVGASGEKVLHIAHVDDGSLLVYIEDEKGEHYYHLSRGDLPTYCDLHDSLIGINYG
ncbi:MAG: hypothetical protein J6D53_11070, partial [Blautia sp.]|nr:hypothetical protein [Blautia sp.]